MSDHPDSFQESLQLIDPVGQGDLESLCHIEDIRKAASNGLGPLPKWLHNPRHLLVATALVQNFTGAGDVREPVGALFGATVPTSLSDKGNPVHLFGIKALFTADHVDGEPVTKFLMEELMRRRKQLQYTLIHTRVPCRLEEIHQNGLNGTHALLLQLGFEFEEDDGGLEYMWAAPNGKA